VKILLLAPQPFYAERGTPIAVDLVLRALSDLGHTVDVLTYAEGEEVRHAGATIHRIPRIPFLRGIRPGPSVKKLAASAILTVQAFRMARRGRYDLVHAVEEAAFAAMAIRAFLGIPYIYDMDSCLSQQVASRYPALGPLVRLLGALEGLAIRRAEAVVPVCEALARTARDRGAKRSVILQDVSLLGDRDPADAGEMPEDLREGTGPIILYVGNLEPYQGVGLLLESFALARARVPSARLVVVGGRDEDVRLLRATADRLGLDRSARFLGPRPVARLGAYLRAADVLVSPRLGGSNTPMKIYSYLHSGKPVVATDLETHRQVLTPEIALLAPPEPGPFADAMARLLLDRSLGERLGGAARAYIERRHSYEAFRATLLSLYEDLDAVVKRGRVHRGDRENSRDGRRRDGRTIYRGGRWGRGGRTTRTEEGR
jgi:glycosyltransferase involved in cell wall biosynthesis